MRLHYTQRAKDDIESALVWYEKQRRGLGFDFLDCVEIAITSIIENPLKYCIYYSCFRSYVISRFPFSIIYSVEENEIIIHSVFDNRKNPDSMP